MMEELKKQALIGIQRGVLYDITVEIQKIKEEGLLIDEKEIMEIINSLSEKYGR